MSSLDNIERLFLLEILVDSVYISRSELDINPRILSSLKQTVVRFQFLNYPALEICEEDFAPSKGKYDEEEISFKSGKSCLFALRGQRPAAFSPPFNMDVTVCRMFENNKSCTIGRTCIKLGECFATIITCCIVCPTSPTSKTIRDTYPLVDDRNCEIGNITVFIRLSCFGKFIITQFQLGGLENKSFLFRAESDTNNEKEKAKEEKTADGLKIITPSQYKPGESISKPETYCEVVGSQSEFAPCGPMGGPFSRQPSLMGGMGMPPPMMAPPMMPGMMGMGMPGFGGGMMPPGRPPMQLMPLPNIGGGAGGEAPSVKIAPNTDYKELTASVNGHELSIKILRKPKIKKESKILASESSSSLLEGKMKQISGEGNQLLPDECMPARRRSSKKERKKTTCPLENERGFKIRKPGGPDKVNVKENFVLRLGNCPPVCYKVPAPPPDPAPPCITERDSQFVEEDMETAKKLYEEFLKEQAKGAKGGEKGKKGKGGGKGKGKKKK